MLILIAAGETQAEIDKIFLGRGDSPFTELGLEQITDAGDTLSAYNLDHAYASDLYRAQETLHAVLRRNTSETAYTLVEELRERSAGIYEGRKYTDIRVGMSPKQYKVWERDPFESPLHGESLMDIEDRLRDWFKDEIMPRLNSNQNILIVSHPDTIKVLIAMARGDDLIDAIKVQIENGLPYFYYNGVR